MRGSRADDKFTPGGVLSNAAQMGPTQPVFDTLSDPGYFDNWPGGLQSPDNPVAILKLWRRTRATTYRAIGNVQADYSLPLDRAGSRPTSTSAIDVTKADRETFSPSVLHRADGHRAGDPDTLEPDPARTRSLEGYLNYAAPRTGRPRHCWT